MKKSKIIMRGIFLDRDGVINELVYHQEQGIIDSPFTLKQFKFIPNVFRGLRRLDKLPLKIVIISNQPGMAKNHFDEDIFEKIDTKMKNEFKKRGLHINKAYYCVHHPEGINKKYKKVCNCRKPKIGLIKKASKELNINLKGSYFIGDGIVDVETGKNAGLITFLLGNYKCDVCKKLEEKGLKPDYIVKDLFEASKIIQALE